MTEEEAKNAYDNLFKVEATRRPKDFTLHNECCINCEISYYDGMESVKEVHRSWY